MLALAISWLKAFDLVLIMLMVPLVKPTIIEFSPYHETNSFTIVCREVEHEMLLSLRFQVKHLLATNKGGDSFLRL